ncbi:MAG TPA: hypothetical protein VIZ17_03955, partial [Acetobacteraceae bacterium]
AVVFAGADGLRRGLSLPAANAPPRALPHSLSQALDVLAANEAVGGWFGPVFLDAYLRHKRAEVDKVSGVDATELCACYADVY